MENIFGKNLAELTELVLGLGLPKFRGKQLAEWLYKRSATDFQQMQNLPKDMRNKLAEGYVIDRAARVDQLDSKDGKTSKFLLNFSDGSGVETVLMRQPYGNSICVSSQVGCNMGCKFCASTIGGKARDLTAGEILSQIFTASKDLGVRISNVVMMGMGEPLDNFDSVVRFLELVGCPEGLGIGMRHISLSTCGVVDKIYKLMERNLQITLSISLHAPFNEMRDTIMPINKRYNIDELITACKKYTDTTGRRISFEYALIKGFNDTPECALKLKELLNGIIAHVNLIPANPVHKDKFVKPDKKAVYAFCDRLNNLGLNATVRRTLGSDIDASCGQLRQKHK